MSAGPFTNLTPSADEQARRLSAYRQLLFELSSSFITLPVDDADQAIYTALSKMARFISAERAYIFRYDFAADRARNTHQWLESGTSLPNLKLPGFAISDHPGWLSSHTRGEPILIPDTSSSPSGPFRKTDDGQHVRSLISLPLMDDSGCNGFVGFDSLSQPRQFDNNEVQLLAVFANLLANLNQRLRIERALFESEHRFRSLFSDIPAISVQGYDSDRRVIYWNQASEELYGYSTEEALGQKLEDLIIPEDMRDGVIEGITAWAAGGQPIPASELTLRRKDGSSVPVFSSHVIQTGASGLEMYCIDIDLSEQKEQARQLRRLAHFDALTGLPNRVLLSDRLHQAMAVCHRSRHSLAVIYLDLDGFKLINDRHGHSVGDRLLTALSQRLSGVVREADTVARIGGDEFAVVLQEIGDVTHCGPMLNRLLATIEEGLVDRGISLNVSASMGVTFYPQNEDIDADQLLRQADQAMYEAKQAGKHRFCFFDIEQDRKVRGHHGELERIQQALKNHEFLLYYQPKVNMRTGEVVGAEALIRWQHPQKGLLSPGAFLPAIEHNRLSIDVGNWVIESALAQLTEWKSAGLHYPVSVNLAALQLQQADFVKQLTHSLARYPLADPHDLELEILETSALDDMAHVSGVIRACGELGITFALDDFGTGYSSLTYLKRLPVRDLKIDQSFVRDILIDTEDLAILQSILSLAETLQRRVIAEGVEQIPHGTMLLELGCELAQGYGIARPMPPSELPGWAAAWRTPPQWRNHSSEKPEGVEELHQRRKMLQRQLKKQL